MVAHRYRIPRGPRVSPRTYKIVRRDGLYLRDAGARPSEWTSREAMALSFRSRADAEALIARRFVGPAAAMELCGIRAVATP